MNCRMSVEHKYRTVDGLEALGDVQTTLSAEGYETEVEEKEPEGVLPTEDPRFVVSATRLQCRCVCEACGHANGSEAVRAKRKAR